MQQPIIVEDHRRRCFFDNETAAKEPAITVHKKPDGQLVVKLGDKELPIGEKEKEKECDDKKPTEPTKPETGVDEYSFVPTPVPLELEASCPCVQPLRGDQCPPGYRLWRGRCRGK